MCTYTFFFINLKTNQLCLISQQERSLVGSFGSCQDFCVVSLWELVCSGLQERRGATQPRDQTWGRRARSAGPQRRPEPQHRESPPASVEHRQHVLPSPTATLMSFIGGLSRGVFAAGDRSAGSGAQALLIPPHKGGEGWDSGPRASLRSPTHQGPPT